LACEKSTAGTGLEEIATVHALEFSVSRGRILAILDRRGAQARRKGQLFFAPRTGST
jgi:hypothetical protein